MFSTKQSPALAPDKRYSRARAPEPVRSTNRALLTNRSDNLTAGMNSGSTPPAPLPSSPWVPPPFSAVGELQLSQPLTQRPATSPQAHCSPSRSPSFRDPSAVMGRVSFSVPVRSVRRPNSPWQGRCYVSCRVPLPPGALHASGGLSCARAHGEAAEGAVGSSPSGVHGFLSAPASRAPGIWKDCAAALSAPDVSLLPPPRSPLSHPSQSQV